MSNTNVNVSPTPVDALNVIGMESESSHAHSVFDRFHWLLTLAEVLGDGLTIALAVLASYFAYRMLHLGVRAEYPLGSVSLVAVGVAVLYVILLDREGAYGAASSLLRIKETENSLRAAMQVFLLVLPVTFFINIQLPRWVFAVALLLMPAFQITEKQIMMSVLQRIRRAGVAMKKVVICGAGTSGRRVFSAMTRSPKLGLRPVAFVDDDPGKWGQDIFDYSYRRDRSLRVAPEPLSVDLLRRLECDFLVLAISTLDRAKVAQIAQIAREADVPLAFISGEVLAGDLLNEYVDLDGVMLSMARNPSKDWYGKLMKRPFDFLGSLLLILLTAPTWLVIALIVRIDSPGPILFKQKRVGNRGKLFDVYKFRSMYVDAPQYAFSPKGSEDPRITKIGRLLRRTSLDELPQLLNVLKGDMSLVGPRPEMPFIVKNYTPLQKQRLLVTPGITGLWQLSADRSELIHENIQYDLYYIFHRSFFMDCAILIHTLLFAMHGV